MCSLQDRSIACSRPSEAIALATVTLQVQNHVQHISLHAFRHLAAKCSVAAL